MERKHYEDYPDILDVTQMCSLLNLGKKLAYRILKEGGIPYRRLGRNYRISKKHLEELFLGK